MNTKKFINPFLGASFEERVRLLFIKRANVDASKKGFYILVT